MTSPVIIFGAGKIARGFLAHLLALSNLPFVFIDKNKSLVQLLNVRRQYTIHVMGHPDKNMSIYGFSALDIEDSSRVIAALRKTSLIFTSVGGQHLGEIGTIIATGLAARLHSSEGSFLNIITCENWIDPAKELSATIANCLSPAQLIAYHRLVGMTEAVILRSAVEPSAAVAKEDPLAVAVQDWWDLPIDGSGLKGDIPRIHGMRVLKEFRGLLARKLYTYNSGNGTVSYLGHLRGHRTIREAVMDPAVIPVLLGVYRETSAALSQKYHVPYQEQYDFAMTAYRKLQDPDIEDFIERNARDPLRKLGPTDRLVGPALLAQSYGIEPNSLAFAIAAALHYNNPADPSALRLKSLRETYGMDHVLKEICGIDPLSSLAVLVKRKIGELVHDGWITERPT